MELSSPSNGHFDLEQRLMRWFNKKINNSNTAIHNTSHLINQRSNINIKCRQIWSQLLLESKADWHLYFITSQEGPSLIVNNWTIKQMKSVLINYQKIWLQTLVISFLNEENDQISISYVPYLSELDLIDYIIKMSAERMYNESIPVIAHLILMIYWLDQAKRECLLVNDPCLFKMPNSSQNVFDKFSQIVFLPERIHRLRYRLKQIGFRLEHKETQIHHMDFRVRNLSSDLADGIRLARLIQLLFPGHFGYLFSRLKYSTERSCNRMENVCLLFRECESLLRCYDRKFEWNQHNASAVAENHQEQTLQTILSLMRIDLAIRVEQHYQPHLAKVIQIQKFVHGWLLTRKLRTQYVQLREAAIVVQRRYRAKVNAYHQRSQYIRLKTSTVFIQRWFRKRKFWISVRNYVKTFMIQRQHAAITIQRVWRGYSIRIKIYVQHPAIHLIVHKLEKSTGLAITIKANKIFRRLTNNIINNDIRCISDLFISDVEHLYHFCCWSKEIRNNIIKWPDLLMCLSQLIVRMNRSEQHKMCTYWIVSIFDLIVDQLPLLVVNFYRPKWISVLIHVMYNHLNYTPLVVLSLRLMCKLISPNVGPRLSHNKKWCRLVKRIVNRYKVTIEDFGVILTNDCNQCQTIQLLLNQLSLFSDN